MTGRAVVGVATTNERVYNFVGREMLQGGIAALAHPIFTTAETLQLIRDILAQQLASSPGPRQVALLYHGLLLLTNTHVGNSVCAPEDSGPCISSFIWLKMA